MSSLLRAMVDGIEQQQIPIWDRGLHFGDGVFRTLLVRAGQPLDWPRQLRRLFDDAARIGLQPPGAEILTRQVAALCAGEDRAILKLLLTRGGPASGYSTTEDGCRSILLLRSPREYPARYWTEGIDLRICTMRLACNPALAGIKHLNRLEQVLARAEWNDENIAEGLMLDTSDRLIEGVSSNVFFIRDAVLHTPDLARCGVAGVTREMILEAAPAYTRTIRIADFGVDDLMNADECFVCNSVIRIWPVARLISDDCARSWAAGPVTQALQNKLGVVWPRKN